jgi:hypothetical protein
VILLVPFRGNPPAWKDPKLCSAPKQKLSLSDLNLPPKFSRLPDFSERLKSSANAPYDDRSVPQYDLPVPAVPHIR